MIINHFSTKMKKNYNLRVYLFFVFAFVMIIPGVFAADPIQITNCFELQNINNNLAGNYVLANDIPCSGYNFIPIGTSSSPFTGIFDGQGHKIKNLLINMPNSNVGLFGYVASGAIIKNVGLEDISITGGVGSQHTGGLVGFNMGGTITNCYATGSVTGSYDVGGLIGFDNHGTITNSYATGSVTGSVGGSVIETYYIGGLIGNSYHGTITNSYATGSVTGGNLSVGGLIGYEDSAIITNCYATGSVTGSIGGSYNIGGLIGFNSLGTITNSYATGSVTGSFNVGGLIGFDYEGKGTFTSSFWDKDTSGQSSSAGGTGKTTTEMKIQATFTGWDFSNIWQMCSGINKGYPSLKSFGVCPPDGTPGNPYQITNCVELQNINNNLNANYILTSDINCAETVGWNRIAYDTTEGFKPIGTSSSPFTGTFDGQNHKITNFFIYRLSTDNVGLFGYINSGVIIKDISLEGVTITGKSYVGGLVGYNDGGTITNCYVVGWSVSNSYLGGDYAGGLVGYNDGGTITNSYATPDVGGDKFIGGLVGQNEGGIITESYAAGPVYDGTKLGGLVGYNNGGTITNSYYAGGIVNGMFYFGGLMGYNNGGTITNSYWDTQTSTQATSAGGTGKTTADMKTQSTFTDASWDFASIWNICEGTTYPWLIWQNVECALPDGDGDGYTSNVDCNDNDASINPGATEICDGVDNNCDGQVDEYINLPPVAEAGGPYTIMLGTSLTLDGSGSHDPNSPCGSIVSYSWTLPTGGVSGVNPTLTWSQVQTLICNGGCGIGRTYAVSLLVTDTLGSTSPEDSAIVIISGIDKDRDGYYVEINDCNDYDATIHPGATELVDDGIDQNCNGEELCFKDADGDGFRPDSFSTVVSIDLDCSDEFEAVSTDPTTDCNDNDAAIHPGAADVICDDIDNNCNGEVDEDYMVTSTTCGVGACAKTGAKTCINGIETNSCNPGTPTIDDTLCNGLDDDCNGVIDEDYVPTSFNCGFGVCEVTAYSQCTNGQEISTCTPGTPGTETCNGLDDDCDGIIDNDLTIPSQSCNAGTGACMRTGTQIKTCNGVSGWSEFGVCSATPGNPTTEICDGVDNNCDGQTDEFYACTWSGFFQPVDNLPAFNQVKAGSAIPVKFSLGGDKGLNIFETGYPKSGVITCTLGATVDTIETTVTAGGSSLNYDPVTKQYNYVWKTEKAWSGTCRQLVVKLNDGTVHTANFKFTK